MAKSYETRTVSAFDVRSDSDHLTIEGYAATFDQPYDMGAFREVVDPAAFNRTLGRSPDVRLLVDHEGQPLARTKSGTMQLRADSTGLHVMASLDPANSRVRDLASALQRRDLDQMSFAFRVSSDGDAWNDDYTMRTLRNVDIDGGDVSVVTYPANDQTSVALRARDLLSAQIALGDALWGKIKTEAELRAGKVISADNMARLKKVLDALAAADDNLDAAEAAVAEILGVADPDNDDADKQATDDMVGDGARAAMPTSNINDLPDSAFAYIEPGGKKDAQGKTTPRNLRHFPIHDADHVRNALARAPQSPFGDKAMPAILAAAKKFGIDANKNSRPLTLALAIAQRLSV